MDTALYLAFVLFAFNSAFTPGPNNYMLMSSGALFGFRRTIPHMTGVAIGFNFVLIAALLGLEAIVDKFPWLLGVVKIAGASWLAWLGLKFFYAALNHKQVGAKKAEKKTRSRPFRFYEAVLFQWVNPKALIMALAVPSAYMNISSSFALRTSLILGTFLVMGFASAGTWTIAGSKINELMSEGSAAVKLNIIMGVLLLGTALMILLAKTTH